MWAFHWAELEHGLNLKSGQWPGLHSRRFWLQSSYLEQSKVYTFYKAQRVKNPAWIHIAVHHKGSSHKAIGRVSKVWGSSLLTGSRGAFFSSPWSVSVWRHAARQTSSSATHSVHSNHYTPKVWPRSNNTPALMSSHFVEKKVVLNTGSSPSQAGLTQAWSCNSFKRITSWLHHGF